MVWNFDLQMNPFVALRYDLSQRIGTGHLRRLMSISSELEKRQISYRFIGTSCATTLFNEFKIPQDKTIQSYENKAERDWLAFSPQFTHVIFDICHEHRKNAGELVRSVNQHGLQKIAVIDSLPPDHFQSDNEAAPQFIVTPYLNAEIHRPPPLAQSWLYGSKFSLLDHEFRQRRENLEESDLKLENNLLICCGGSDPDYLTEMILKQLVQQDSLVVRTTVVMGNLFSFCRKNALHLLVNQCGLDIHLVDGSDGIGKYLESCTFVIARVGLIRYEAACLGKNMFLILDRSRYEAYLRGFESSKFGRVFFLDQDKDKHSFNQFLQSLGSLEKVNEYSQFNQIAADAVDGRGIPRFLDLFLGN